jgi:hypothetical protein
MTVVQILCNVAVVRDIEGFLHFLTYYLFEINFSIYKHE